MFGLSNIQSPKSAAVQTFPVWPTVLRSYVLTAGNLSQLARMSLLPLVIMLPFWMVAPSLVAPWQPQDPNADVSLMTRAVLMLPNLVTAPFLTSIAVYWHNLVLRDERVSGWLNLRLDATVWTYTALAFAINLLIYIPMLLLGHDTPLERVVGIVAGFGVLGFILPRLALALPAIAIGQRLDLLTSWSVTSGNGLRLGCAMLLTYLPPWILAGAGLSFLRRSMHWSQAALLPLDLVAAALVVVVSLTMLSLAYEFFVPLRNHIPASYRGSGI